jgi:hypothetical protein
MHAEIEKEIFETDQSGFNHLAVALFRYQYDNNPLYRKYCEQIQAAVDEIDTIQKIPFLPISFFKTREVKTTSFTGQVFESSGTSGSGNSKHFVKDISIYEQSFLQGFSIFYGDPREWCVLGLLPSYLERKNSSLVYMVNKLIEMTAVNGSGFYLHDHGALKDKIRDNENSGKKTLLIGVTYALLDFGNLYPMELRHTTIMETGGMKGRKKEITREEVHAQLRKNFSVEQIHSEYGMTELLSQAYSRMDGLFQCPPWMRVLLRSEDDPFMVKGYDSAGPKPMSGIINIIDLANIYSCAFIATDDVGKLYNDGSFEVAGRLDNSENRGCGLMLL